MFFFRNFAMLLFCSLAVASCGSNKATVMLSQKYSPPYNPGGSSFNSDRNLLHSYDIYKKRRTVIEQQEKNRTQVIDTNSKKSLSKTDINQKLNSYGVMKNSNSVSSSLVSNKTDARVMMNNNGIDLASLDGAKMIEIDDSSWGPLPVTPVEMGEIMPLPQISPPARKIGKDISKKARASNLPKSSISDGRSSSDSDLKSEHTVNLPSAVKKPVIAANILLDSNEEKNGISIQAFNNASGA